MKKILLPVLILCCLIASAIYIFIPSQVSFTKVVYIKTNINNADRYLSDKNKWIKWWPAVGSADNGSYTYKYFSYTVSKQMTQGMNILIMHDSVGISSFFHIIPINSDTSAVEWKGEFVTTFNPLKRIGNYLLAVKAKKNVDEILQNAKQFLENIDSVYGLHIVQEKVKDTILISNKKIFINYPSTENIYEMIGKLKEYINTNGASETNSPVVNITSDSGIFKTMVAIPINKIIPENKQFVLKKMVPGKILIADVKGGTYSANEALRTVGIYMDDYHLTAPAIPFQSFVTDRMKEPDTTKWVTRIFYPVM